MVAVVQGKEVRGVGGAVALAVTIEEERKRSLRSRKRV